MFRIFLFVAVFFGIIYGIFKLFFHLSNSLLLIDETFINYIKSIDDNTIQKFINEEDFLEKTKSFLEKSLDQKTNEVVDQKTNEVVDQKTNEVVDQKTNEVVDQKVSKATNEVANEDKQKKLNRHLRLDFFISLVFGIIWFLFPLLIINLPGEHIKKKDSIYIGKTLGLFTLISSLWPLFNISKKDYKYKRNILVGKFTCAILTMISFLLIVFFRKTMSFGNIISVIMTAFWVANGYYGLLK
jgi:cation transport ATPase